MRGRECVCVCAYVCDSLEVAAIDEGTVHSLNRPHCLLPLGVGDVGSHTGALQRGRRGEKQCGSHLSLNKRMV